jgi:hypothetical protein
VNSQRVLSAIFCGIIVQHSTAVSHSLRLTSSTHTDAAADSKTVDHIDF